MECLTNFCSIFLQLVNAFSSPFGDEEKVNYLLFNFIFSAIAIKISVYKFILKDSIGITKFIMEKHSLFFYEPF